MKTYFINFYIDEGKDTAVTVGYENTQEVINEIKQAGGAISTITAAQYQAGQYSEGQDVTDNFTV